jgi:hypothetical protein
MSEAITRLLHRTTVDVPAYDDQQSMVFIVDAAHAKAAWTVIMQQSAPFTFDQLWFGTPWQAEMLKGPTWFVLPASAIVGMAAVCHQRPKGIALRCRDPQQALVHARKLLGMPLGHSGYTAFYNPVIWTALVMESGHHPGSLLGPWDAVYTPAPSTQKSPQGWYEWRVESPDENKDDPWPPTISDQVLTAYKDLRWLYWLRDNPAHFGNVPDAGLPRAVSNLDFLVEHGIGIDSHLLELSSLIAEGDLSQRTDLLPIFTSPERPHRRVAQLLEALKP